VEALLDSGALHELATDPTAREALVTALAETADPTAALRALVSLATVASDREELLKTVTDRPQFRRELLAVLGGSAALAEHLVRHPEHWTALSARDDSLRPSRADLRDQLLGAVGADTEAAEPVAADGLARRADALRIAYRRALLRLAARDLAGGAAFEEVSGELADLAGATLEAALAIARAMLPADAVPARLAVISMGKCGGSELNYVSDVDVIFVAEPMSPGDAGQAVEAEALATATRLAATMMRVCGETTREGTIWPVDAALRPEGKAGPLVRTIASHRSYYERWATTWEFQALLKARPIAGDLELGTQWLRMIEPMVWRAADRPGFVEDVQAMRRRVESHVPMAKADRQLKLGPGGLRDVEFSVQLLQLVHGRVDQSLRSGTTLSALEALTAGGYVGRRDGAELADAYRFLRTLEHRIQLERLRRTHLLPDDEGALRRLGRSMGYRADPARELTAEWRRHAREVRRLHEKLFYRPLLAAVARLPGDDARLSPAAARARLEALGYVDPAGALRHIEALTAGTRRAAAIQRTLLPVMLGWFAGAADPDGGLLAFRRASEALGSTHWYLRLLRDEGIAAERVARVLASSRFAAELLLRAPEAVAMLADDAALVPRDRVALETEMSAAVRRAEDVDTAVASVRATRRRELFRIAAADILGLLDIRRVGAALTALTAATLSAGLQIATAVVAASRGGSLPCRFAVIGLGRLGGHEQSYGSDADVMFVYEAVDGAAESDAAGAALAIATELRRLLVAPGSEPSLTVDAGLRPEGRQGALVRTLDAYASYYARWSHVWEAQALLRAEPVAGDAELGARFAALADDIRWPGGGLPVEAVREIRRIKSRIEAERLPRGSEPRRNTKLGPGGLADVEWTVQLLQLQHGVEVPALRTTETQAALAAAEEAGLLRAPDAAALREAWQLAARARNAIVLARGRADDALPTNLRELDRVARLLGYGSGQARVLVEDYLRVARRARAVVNRVFYA